MKILNPIDQLIDQALQEDLGEEGDITTENFFLHESKLEAVIITRQQCMFAGLDISKRVFDRIDPSLLIKYSVDDGKLLDENTEILRVSGSSRSILAAERTVLNFLARLSGIATLANLFSNQVDKKVILLDTRKTLPGWRLLEKQAIKIGGCHNHRFGLFDAILIKDNHLASLKDISEIDQKIDTIRTKYPNHLLEIEADNLEQVSYFLKLKQINIILLDNMSIEMLKAAVQMRNHKNSSILLEASGGITVNNVALIAETGIDRISIGALTHSVPAVDFSLEIVRYF